MACTCKRDMEEKLKGKGYERANLLTGAYFFEDGSNGMKWASTTDASYIDGKTKSGKDRVKKIQLIHRYCPFCGKQYE